MPARRSQPVTIRDVARFSGVSIATVTRTFQDSPLVRPETRERVLAAAEKLGYRPDATARTLVTGRSETIGMLVPSLTLAYWGEVADAIEHRAGDLGYSFVLASSRGEPDRERAMLDTLFGKRLDGIIVAGVAGDPHDWPSGGPRRPPLVLLEWDSTPQRDLLDQLSSGALSRRLWQLSEQQVPGEWLAHVSYDDIAGAEQITQHLLDQGHTEIAYIAGPPVRTCLLRLLGVRSALESAGVPLRYVEVTADTLEGGRAAGAKLLVDPSRPTAFICYSDIIAVGLMRAAHELGLAVPDDLSITGYDDLAISSFVDPPLTTIRNPKQELGLLALKLLLEPPTGPADRNVQLTGSLIERDSTGPPTESAREHGVGSQTAPA